MFTSRRVPTAVRKSLLVAATIALAAISGPMLTSGPATAAPAPAITCPTDTHWNAVTQTCDAGW